MPAADIAAGAATLARIARRDGFNVLRNSDSRNPPAGWVELPDLGPVRQHGFGHMTHFVEGAVYRGGLAAEHQGDCGRGFPFLAEPYRFGGVHKLAARHG